MTEQKFDKDTYPTPLSIFNPLDNEFVFTCDGCASAENAKVPEFFITKEQNFLTYPLNDESVFVNPPYSKLLPFIERAVSLFENSNCLVVMLLPVDISTKWFALVTQKATEIRFIVGGRVKFLNGETGKYTDVCRGNVIAIFNPYQKAMNQVIRHVHIDSFKGLEWKNNGD